MAFLNRSIRAFSLLLSLSSYTLLLGTGQPLPQLSAPDVSVPLGLSANLVCSLLDAAAGRDDLTLTIDKAGSPELRVTNSSWSVTLSIEEVTREHAGAYVCMISTTTSTMTATTGFNLEVIVLTLTSPPTDLVVMARSNASFSCEYDLELMVTWYREEDSQRLVLNASPHYTFTGDTRRVLTIIGATYRDMGRYICQATSGIMMIEGSAMLTLTPAYEPLMSRTQSGQSLIVTEDRLIIVCPVIGVPGPSIINWRGIDTTPPTSLTNKENTDRGPFIDEEGRLDFSEARVADTGRYQCEAVDELGSTVTHIFFVEVTHVSDFFLWTQWYMILVYCVVGVVLLAILILLIWFCCSLKSNWCFKDKKIVKERKRVRTSRPLFVRTPIRDEGIDDYAA